MVAKESSNRKVKSVIPLRMLVTAPPIPLASGLVSMQYVANMELLPLLASTSIATSSVDIMKVIDLLLNKSNYVNKSEHVSDGCISIPHYKSKRGRELYDKALAGISLAQYYKLIHSIALKYLCLLRRTSDTFY